MSEPTEPNTQRREMIDAGHLEPDPTRDKLTHEEWRKQGSFIEKVKQSFRRTMDDFTGRTSHLEEKARHMDGGITDSTPKESRQNTGHSTEQEKWRAEMKSRRDQQRGRKDERDR